jgi:hypothetical protein
MTQDNSNKDGIDPLIKLLVGMGDIAETSKVEAESPNQFEELSDVIKSINSESNYAGTDDSHRVIAALMRESTGAAIMDSGGAYGRAWQINRKSNLEAEPHTILKFRVGKYNEIEYTRSMYHWLCERLDYAPALDAEFLAYSECEEFEDSYWMEIMESFVAYKAELDGETLEFDRVINTYNGECNLDGTLQYVMGYANGEEFYLIQHHGGADVRGGYTRPVAFWNNGNYSEYALFDVADGYIYCNECDSTWSSDDSYHWYSDAYPERGYDLDSYHFIDIDDLPMSQQLDILVKSIVGSDSGYKRVTVEGEYDRRLRRHETKAIDKPILYVRDYKAICPVCMQGYLQA